MLFRWTQCSHRFKIPWRFVVLLLLKILKVMFNMFQSRSRRRNNIPGIVSSSSYLDSTKRKIKTGIFCLWRWSNWNDSWHGTFWNSARLFRWMGIGVLLLRCAWCTLVLCVHSDMLQRSWVPSLHQRIWKRLPKKRNGLARKRQISSPNTMDRNHYKRADASFNLRSNRPWLWVLYHGNRWFIPDAKTSLKLTVYLFSRSSQVHVRRS